MAQFLVDKNKAYLGAGPSVRTTDASKVRLIITKSFEVISNFGGRTLTRVCAAVGRVVGSLLGRDW